MTTPLHQPDWQKLGQVIVMECRKYSPFGPHDHDDYIQITWLAVLRFFRRRGTMSANLARRIAHCRIRDLLRSEGPVRRSGVRRYEHIPLDDTQLAAPAEAAPAEDLDAVLSACMSPADAAFLRAAYSGEPASVYRLGYCRSEGAAMVKKSTLTKRARAYLQTRDAQ